uniref:Uncharacterized protein n=1 Tax=Staphylococcus arlettae TaxID=29378 RepID=A0A1W5QG37_9STAP|nr:hypothetical protein [Staphylococcus arlettae]
MNTCLLYLLVLDYFLMAEEEGFEPPRAVKPLSVFKTDPFSRTWVFLQTNTTSMIL